MSNLNKNGNSKANSYICTNLELIIGSLQHCLDLIILTQVTLLVEVQLIGDNKQWSYTTTQTQQRKDLEGEGCGRAVYLVQD